MPKKKIPVKNALDGTTGVTPKKVIFSVNISIAHKEKFKAICRSNNRSQSNMFEQMIDLYPIL